MKNVPFACCALLLAACLPGGVRYDETVTLVGPEETVSIRVEVAETSSERERGLMERDFLPEDTGMLFVFQEEQPLTFWMKNTIIPLDVLFFRDDGSFVSAASMVPCESATCPLYASAEPAMFALEVPAGFLDQHAVDDGWRLDRGR